MKQLEVIHFPIGQRNRPTYNRVVSQLKKIYGSYLAQHMAQLVLSKRYF